jgi:hypothetical protein
LVLTNSDGVGEKEAATLMKVKRERDLLGPFLARKRKKRTWDEKSHYLRHQMKKRLPNVKRPKLRLCLPSGDPLDLLPLPLLLSFLLVSNERQDCKEGSIVKVNSFSLFPL